jgi:glucosamine--fructose-6-phosphate aminotransferase (isomerizing)
MCGIIGYLGKKNAKEVLLNGLKKMEYRGYDSAGFVLLDQNNHFKSTLVRSVGKIDDLIKKASTFKNIDHCQVGIAHTRWATHGGVEERNAHPIPDSTHKLFVVHNGIIENYRELKTFLISKGHQFSSETDTEVIAELVSHLYTGDLLEAVKKALSLAEGAFGIAILHQDHPDTIIVARNGSPIVLGIGKNEMFVASDIQAMRGYIKDVIYIDDNEIVEIHSNDFAIYKIDSGEQIDKEISEISQDIMLLTKEDFPDFMLKEIYEQTFSIVNTYQGKVDFTNNKVQISGFFLSSKQTRDLHSVKFLACGSSWHVGLIGKYLVEKLARIPASCEYSSEFHYRYPVIKPNEFFAVISQSGETADTLSAMKLIKESGGDIFGITNVVGSSIARNTKGGMYIHAGHEDGVAATKTFTSQLMAVTLLAIHMAIVNNAISQNQVAEIFASIKELSGHIQAILNQSENIRKIALNYKDATNALFLGRDLNFPIALEGALKLKEISYIHAEGYPAAEMKHGPLALVDENMPCFCIATHDSLYKKMLSNIQELKARKGNPIIIANHGNQEVQNFTQDIIFVPQVHEIIQPILNVIPFQLIAYYIATQKGLNVDRPRNLAKSVTVE